MQSQVIHSSNANIKIPDHTFASNTEVHVQIHSQPQVVGIFTTNGYGGITNVVDIPPGLTDGYHTVHIYGLSASGIEQDLYQTIWLGREQEPDAVVKVAEFTVPEIRQPTTHIGGDQRIAMQTPRSHISYLHDNPPQNDVLGVSLQGKNPDSKMAIVPKSHHREEIFPWWVLVLSLGGIMAVWLLFVRQLKK